MQHIPTGVISVVVNDGEVLNTATLEHRLEVAQVRKNLNLFTILLILILYLTFDVHKGYYGGKGIACRGTSRAAAGGDGREKGTTRHGDIWS